MPSMALQSKIKAFESLSDSNVAPKALERALSTNGHDFLESPPPSTLQLPSITPSSSRPVSPQTDRRESVLDMREWVTDVSPSPPHSNGSLHRTMSGDRPQRSASGNAPLISFDSPPRTHDQNDVDREHPGGNGVKNAPPLPPRKPSVGSLKVAAASKPKPIPPPRPPRSDTLTVDHTYPPGKTEGRNGHVPASSISSFHSISLSSEAPSTPGSVSSFIATYPMDRQSSDNGSENDSFENISSTSLASPTAVSRLAAQWEKQAKGKPPELPQRPIISAPVTRPPSVKSPPPLPSHSMSSPSSPRAKQQLGTRTSTSSLRRPPPPPLPPLSSRSSDRSSVTSNATAASIPSHHHQTFQKPALARPTPVPVPARKRYELVFSGNVVARRKAAKLAKPLLLDPVSARKSRSAAGWRGLSVDLITDKDHPLTSTIEDENTVSADDVLEGYIVQHIWLWSKLDKPKLKQIWNECDPSGKGSLNRDAFVKGMWRIDEELRRAAIRSSASASPSSAMSSFHRYGPLHRAKSKSLLR